jgi:acetyl-CoA C-acetyltransferase
MVEALQRAARDAGSLSLLENADRIAIPRGFWDYKDPGRLVAAAVGATRARSEITEIGVLQTTLFGRAARDIAEGECDIVLVAGGEARHRARRMKREGTAENLTEQPEGTTPDEVLRPTNDILSPFEIGAGLLMPVGAYAIMENALRAHEAMGLALHRDQVAQLWSEMSRVAAGNPDAWRPEFIDPQTIRNAGPKNAMLNFPYTKLHNSNWNVDQAAGLVFCSAETAQRAGIPRERWVFPVSVVESNHMAFMSVRRELHRSHGFALAGERALSRSGQDASDVAHRELYSCFPSAVRIQQRELGFEPDTSTTVTGGMAFAGGPLNNFVLQAMAKMAQVLRDDPGALGMVNAVSGLMTKQGVTLWSTEPRADRFLFDDVSDLSAAAIEEVAVDDDVPSQARIAGYTVTYEADEPRSAILLCDREDGSRSLIALPDPDLALRLTREEGCGRDLRFTSPERAEFV